MRIVISSFLLLAACSAGNPSKDAAVDGSALDALSAPEAAIDGASSDATAADAEATGPTKDGAAFGRASASETPANTLSTTHVLSWIWEKPNFGSPQVGWFRAGNYVTYGENVEKGPGVQPCAGQWVKVIPAGYICLGRDGTTTDLKHPSVVAARQYGAKDEPLPFAYGMSYGTKFYTHVPTPEEQKATESDPDGWRKQVAAMHAKMSPERRPPEFAMEPGEMPAFLADHAQAPNIMPYPIGKNALTMGYAISETRLAFVSAFEQNGRSFYLTTEHFVVPTDRIKAAKPSTFHGVELADAGSEGVHLPLVWARFKSDKMPATIFKATGDEVVKTDVILKEKGWAGVTEKDVTIKGQRYHELVTVPDGLEKPEEGSRYLIKTGIVTRLDLKNFTGEGLSAVYPSGVGDDDVWIDVDLSRQTAVLYQGKTPKYATLVSTGAGGKKRSTPLGIFRIYQKHKTARMHGDEKPPEEDEDGEGEKPYRYDDVPWIQYLHKGIALHTAFWHDGFGMPRSHGCINLSPADAKYLFDRTLPKVPDGWHGLNASRGGFPVGTIVVIHG